MNYCRNLSFKHVPDYAYLKNLFKKMAAKEDIDLNDKLFDWSIKAITIQAYPHFYDFFQYQYFNPLNKKGKFTHINSNDRKSKKTEEEIYKLSAYFKFRSNPKQLMNLLNQKKVKNSREPDRMRLEQQIDEVKIEKEKILKDKQQNRLCQLQNEIKQFKSKGEKEL